MPRIFILTIEFEGCDWILAGGLDGWVDAEDDAYNEAGGAGDAKDLPGNMWSKWGNERDEEGEDIAEDEAHQAADDAEDEGFEEELKKDVARTCADCLADTDFAGAFRNGDEHDVHDANATNDERDARDEGEHAGNNREHRAGRVKIFVAGDKGEGAVAILGFSEFFLDVCLNVGNSVNCLGTNVDLLNLNRRFEGAGVLDVNQNCVIKIDVIVVDWVINLIENTDNHELLAVVAKSAGDGFGGAEERHREVVADDRDVFAEAVVEELAILKFEIENILKVIVRSNNCVRLVNVFADRDCSIANCDWSNAFDVFDLADGFDILECEARF